MVRWLKNRWASTASQLEKPCGYTGRSPIRKKTTRATTGRNPFKSFFFISSKCTSFSLHPSIWNRLEKPQTWRGTLERRRFQTESDAQNGRKEIPAGERERENIGPFSRSLIFIYSNFIFSCWLLPTRMKRSDQHPINRQSIFRKRDSTQNK